MRLVYCRDMRQVLIVALCLIALGCANHQFDNPAAPSAGPNLTAPSLLSLAASPGPSAGTATVVATVTNLNGTALADIAVTFSVDVGSIDPSALTNAKGVATVTLTGQPGAAKITARVGASLAISTLVAIQPGPAPMPPPQPTPPPVLPPPVVIVPLVVQLFVTPAAAGNPTVFSMTSTAGIASATWSFGDASASVTTSTVSTTHAYAAGHYSAGLTVVDSLGRTAASPPVSVTIAAVPVPPPPAPAYTVTVAAVPAAVLVGGSSTLTATAVQQNGAPTPTGFAWDCAGTGTFVPGGNPQSCTYLTAGTFTAAVKVTGGLATGTGTVSVIAAAPVLSVNCTVGSTLLTQPVTCVASFTVGGVPFPSNGITSVSWDFGDHSTTTSVLGNTATHSYAAALGYTVVATATIVGTSSPAIGSASVTVN